MMSQLLSSEFNSLITNCNGRRRKLLNLNSFVIVVFVNLLNFNNFQKVLTLNSVLDLNGTFPYLLNKTTNQIIEPRDYMDFDNIYTPNETYKWEQTSQGRNYHVFKAFDFANYYQTDYWHYSNKEDLLLSALPVANKDLCAKQLDWIENQLNDTTNNKLFSNGLEHINLMNLIDSFGRPEAGTFFGHLYWLGSHFECVRTSINTNRYHLEESCASPTYRRLNNQTCHHEQQQQQQPQHLKSSLVGNKQQESILKTRYCIGKARDIDWPNEDKDNYIPKISYKVGLCLPEACETLSFARHRYQLERLMRFNIPEYMRNRIYLDDLYCLPDSRSPIRSFSLSSRIFLIINAAWLALSLVSTAIYSCYKRHQSDIKSIVLTSKHEAEAAAAREQNKPVDFNKYNRHSDNNNQHQHHHHHHHHHPHLTATKTTTTIDNDVSIKNKNDNKVLNNADHLSMCASYRSSSSSLALWLSESPIIIKISQCLSVKENLKEFQRPPLLLRQPNSYKYLRINLNALDSIKCLCCILVILGHIIFIHMQHLSSFVHAIEISNSLYPRLLIAFFNFVDTFFIISGMLFSYFVFKRFNLKTLSRPIIWFNISLMRLLRLSPIYILTLWFCKTISVYLYEGPLWDYGTDKNSIRGLCINDHWWKSIIYFGNVGTMQPLCMLPSWSIIIDSQYSLIIPPILYLLLKNKRLAYLIIVLATLISTGKMSYQLANQTAVKPSDMAKIRLHVYPAISRFAAEFYNTAWNRIGPVAIGVFGGHLLYLYDIGKLKQWPSFMRGSCFKLILLMHLFIFMLPTLSKVSSEDNDNNNSSHEDNNYNSSHIDSYIFLLANAAIKPVWSLINTILLLRLVTDLRHHSVLAKLSSHNLWHCLGKLCFVSYLIHYEIILILLKSREEGMMEPNWPNVLREFSLVFLISSILAYVVHILYEAPINKLITLILSKQEYSKETTTTTSATSNSNSIITNDDIQLKHPNGDITLRNNADHKNHIHINHKDHHHTGDFQQHNPNGQNCNGNHHYNSDQMRSPNKNRNFLNNVASKSQTGSSICTMNNYQETYSILNHGEDEDDDEQDENNDTKLNGISTDNAIITENHKESLEIKIH